MYRVKVPFSKTVPVLSWKRRTDSLGLSQTFLSQLAASADSSSSVMCSKVFQGLPTSWFPPAHHKGTKAAAMTHWWPRIVPWSYNCIWCHLLPLPTSGWDTAQAVWRQKEEASNTTNRVHTFFVVVVFSGVEVNCTKPITCYCLVPGWDLKDNWFQWERGGVFGHINRVQTNCPCLGVTVVLPVPSRETVTKPAHVWRKLAWFCELQWEPNNALLICIF